LSPLSILWHVGTSVRNIFSAVPWTAPIPVVCIGNVTTGGAGKTPVAIDLTRALMAKGLEPHLLSRGFGGTLSGPIRVDRQVHSAADVGDEPLLLADAAPTWVSRDRIMGAQAAISNGASIIVMDDGFQNPSICKTLSILVIDGEYGFGNGKILPAGPLRETPSSGLARCDAVVLIGEDRHNVTHLIGDKCTIYRARIVAYADPEIIDKRVFAFAGIARPSKFYQTLLEMGCDVAGTTDFDDHHKFQPDEIMKLCDTASALDAIPVTTEKDYIRLPKGARALIKTVRISLEWEKENARDLILKDILADG